MLTLLKDLLWSPASFKDAMAQLGLGLLAAGAVFANIGWPQTPKEWATIGLAAVAGWAGKTVNKR
jgi:hypothetical protein